MISASANRTNTGIALSSAQRRIGELSAENARLKATVRELQDLMRGCQINGRSVMADVSRKREIPVEQLLTESRSKAMADARHEAMYEVARRCPWLTVTEIAHLFRCGHSTVSSALATWPIKARAHGIELPMIAPSREPNSLKGKRLKQAGEVE